VRTDGSVACWGDDSYGKATPPAGTFTQVSAAYHHTCGVRTDGTLACWGGDSYGKATPPAGTFTQVSAGTEHTCGVGTDGTLACWGSNYDITGTVWVGQATPPTGTFGQVSAGAWHTCGVRTDGTLACWGRDDYWQATPPAGTFTQVSAGWNHTCGVRTDGTLACWGRDIWGRDIYGKATPPAGAFTQVSAGTEHTCGVRTNGTLACWGEGVVDLHDSSVTIAISACTPPFTPIVPDDRDCDGAPDEAEHGSNPALCGTRDPNDPWDFYDVPAPTLFTGGGIDNRDSAVTILSDVLGVLEYTGISPTFPCNGGPDMIPGNEDDRCYDQDKDGDGYDDGLAYDRSVGATWSGPPDGAITILTDVLLVLDQTGTSCAP
jgi:hypothetical protein